MKRVWHVPHLLVTFLVSFIALGSIDLFMGPDTPDAIMMILGGVFIMHLLAFGIGLCLPRRKLLSHLAVISVPLIPIGYLWSEQIRESNYLKYEAVYDRFRENLADPIPSSVANLEFIDLDESRDTHLMFQFEIAPTDLHEIIESRGFKETDVSAFRCPVDRFRDPAYLPLREPVSFYTIEDNKMGYPEPGWGEGFTLKVGGDRRSVVFRRESAAFYRYKYWDQRTAQQDAEVKRGQRRQ